MNPIAQAVLSVVAFVVIVVVTLGVARKKAKAKGEAFPDFRYIRMSMLTLALAGFAGGIYFIVGQLAPDSKIEGRIAIAASSCWVPLYFIAYRYRKKK
jgi:hypothetical protein